MCSVSTISSPDGVRTSRICLTIIRFELLRHDVIEPIFWKSTEFYNLACPASPIHYQYNPVKTVKTNVMGAINMLVWPSGCHAHSPASTSEVYGDPQVHPQTKLLGQCKSNRPRSCTTKASVWWKTLMTDYHRQNNVDIRIARIFNTYGPRMLENERVCSHAP